MSTCRQIRRQTRRARKAGLQPIVVIDSPSLVPAGVLLARWAWRYRSEIAPATTAGAVFLAGWWLHHGHAGLWAWQADRLGDVGPRGDRALHPHPCPPTPVRPPWDREDERAGAEDLRHRCCERAEQRGGREPAAGREHGCRRVDPFGEPGQPDPCAGHGQRERGQAGGGQQPGSKIQSATVDLWGWRARVRLARGQTIAEVTARMPAIESALGTYRGAVRVYPTGDGKANRCELRVLDTDPHAEAIPWPGPSARSIAEPVDLGPSEDAEPCRVSFLRRHALFAGTTGSGKSGGLNVLMGTLASCDDAVIWAIDLKKGMELQPWAPCIDRLGTTPGEAAALLADAVAILQARAAHLAAAGRRVWQPSPEMPALVIIVDEYAELADEAPGAMGDTDSIARLGRAVAVTLIAATQRPTQKAMGQGAVRSQMDTRICFRVRERKDVDLVLGQGMLGAGWHAHTLNAPGKFLVSAPEHATPRRARAYLVTDDDVSRTVACYGPHRPQLDNVSRAALNLGPAVAEPVPWYLIDRSRDAQSDPDEPGGTPDGYDTTTLEGALWVALCSAPGDGSDIAELMRTTGMGRSTVYRYLAQLAEDGRAVQVGWGRWRAARPGDQGHDE